MSDYNEMGLPADARLAAKVLRKKDVYSTGQSVLLECADRIESLIAERDALLHDLERIKDSETYEVNRAEAAYEAGVRAGLKEGQDQ